MLKVENMPVEVDVEYQDEGLEDSPYLESRLTSYMKEAWDKARMFKQSITERLLSCDRQRRGEYDPEKAMQIKSQGGSEIYMMITDVKCRAASSWIKDVMLQYQDRPWTLDIAELPKIPPEIEMSITDKVQTELQQFLQLGQQLHPETFRTRLEELHDQIRLQIQDEARDTARRMEDLIEDQMNHGNFKQAFSEFIDDFVTYPCAILKGPTVRKKKQLTWGEQYTPIVVNNITREIERVSPYDIFPSPSSMGVDDGYIMERHKLNRAKLEALVGVPGYSKENIESAIDHYQNTGYKFYEYGDSEKEDLDGNFYNQTFNDPNIEALEFWGPVTGELLIDWGIKDKTIEENKQYEANIWVVGSYVIKAIINPDPLGRRPYNIASWEVIPGNFWGVALPEIMRDVQTMCNASARSLANNMGIASGPQVEAVVDRLADGEDLTAMYPWKIWQTTSDKTGGGQPGVRFFQPNMQAPELMGIYQTFAKQADEVTGIPNYIYGSSSVGGAGRTASGLSMLMDNASKGIKQAVAETDKVVAGVVERFYVHNMIYNPDPFIKGDFKVTPKGAMGLIMKEQIQRRRNEFLTATANPVDLQIVGQEGRAYLLRELAKGLQMDTDKLVKSQEVLKHEAQMQQIAMQQMQEQQMQQQMAAQELDPAGNPAGGADANIVNR